MLLIPTVSDVLVGVVLKGAWRWLRGTPRAETESLTQRDETIMQEAFFTGRVYSAMGEKEVPHEIQAKLRQNCLKALRREEAWKN